MATNTPRAESRPVYMQIFIDKLRKHNNAQIKYTPSVRLRRKTQNYGALGRRISPSQPVAKTMSPMTAKTKSHATQASTSASNQPSTSFKETSSPSYHSQNSTSLSLSNRDIIAAGGPRSGSELGSVKGVIRRRTGAVPNIQASMQYNHDSASRSNTPAQRPMPVSPLSGPIMNKLPSLRKALGKFGTMQQSEKGSSTPFSQTPAAAVGTGRSSSKSVGYKKTQSGSLAKTIAEQTPNGFKTLGPGFRGSTEKSSNNLDGGMGSQLSSMPSDYEHIFHAPSAIDGSSESVRSSKQVKQSNDKTTSKDGS